MTREMTAAQFRAALRRNRFGNRVLWWFEDLDNQGRSYSGIFTVTGKLLRRETIRHLLAERRRAEAGA